MALGLGHATHLDLVFTPMEVVAVMLTVVIVVVLGMNGQTNWFEGVLLLALYVILASRSSSCPPARARRRRTDALARSPRPRSHAAMADGTFIEYILPPRLTVSGRAAAPGLAARHRRRRA